jgi:hypothetical protein
LLREGVDRRNLLAMETDRFPPSRRASREIRRPAGSPSKTRLFEAEKQRSLALAQANRDRQNAKRNRRLRMLASRDFHMRWTVALSKRMTHFFG